MFKPFKRYKFIPSIEKSLHTYLYPADWDSIRNRILERDNYTCSKCKKEFRENPSLLRVHHIVPLSRGGNSSFSNLITVCWKCHKLFHKHL